ncbi:MULTISPECIES: hypothetical protein [unclassified Nostoc]|uniref:hypothetical protein n=1 Tax=unclassified Nostoc TaxID=2593658 RepID=UPI002AD5169D|nr:MULTISPECIES: hypothetical protein [unclassified Nostoc]MDZ7949696.1 hypothetical protein [Nostoc sp. DedQUE09]MDZ8031418.1 hypothetical protein [Nostoc sp. DedSLP04]MDZ8094810.1 hypothetical protein [Nostoc sp. DedQUE05]MDZ8129094.1 hypothetical protein [Nostoc sp. DedQUE07]MDZ8138498.1 hypothetical protein [Nostoc sp. DedQUE04]
MNAGLKRIEATLHDLGNRGTASTAETTDSTTKRPFSFRISVGANEPTESTQIPSSQDEEVKSQGQTVDLSVNTENYSPSDQNFFPHHESVQTFQAEENGNKTPSLPKLKTPTFSSHRHGANPALAMNLLQEIQETVAGWQTELQNILKQIQDIYLEGPIVNGWLESNPPEPEPGGTATLRHAEVDRLMNYVEEICATGGKVSYQSSITGYRLCGVDDTGKVWSRPCPPDQVPNVSMAIARYQKLRQLLGRKQSLETRLSQLAQTLVVLHSHIQQT